MKWPESALRQHPRALDTAILQLPLHTKPKVDHQNHHQVTLSMLLTLMFVGVRRLCPCHLGMCLLQSQQVLWGMQLGVRNEVLHALHLCQTADGAVLNEGRGTAQQ